MEIVENYKDEFHKYIDLIEAAIIRMAQNSFLIKGWTLSVVGIVFGLGSKGGGSPTLPFFCALLIVITFGGLDAYYLWLERRFRRLYKDVILKARNGLWGTINWYDMDADVMNAEMFVDSLLSPSIYAFYPVLIVGVVVFAFVV